MFATVNDNNYVSVIDVGRKLYKTIKKLENECLSVVKEYDEQDTENILWGCAASISDDKFAKMPIKNEVARKKIEGHRQAVVDLNAEAYFLTQQLTPFLRTVYGADLPDNSKPALDFSNLYINNGDFSGLDLSQWDIHNTIFGFINLTGADLRVFKAEGSEFRSCNWWDAKAINANLLLYGIKSVYPYTYSGQTFPVEVNKEDYTEKVRRLCASAHAACPAELDFGQP